MLHVNSAVGARMQGIFLGHAAPPTSVVRRPAGGTHDKATDAALIRAHVRGFVYGFATSML